ncbi:SIR2 family NAD-dependent protein deacylase [Pseudalkalibacillus berkeleyi]|uniref:protein acetyllysine N-acetyltransferase n=1 Tax=Pseudalkalibacillus berkeleyi TaxID=1069813 RepID=A0ABS9GUI7_9BACL|nr:NAD-dependent deacylase [Pseudalkalibacillus berkeleyi]MCF6136344.1 NAD-dependent deacylase [Pseudalkalibacillus berkeleyi]
MDLEKVERLGEWILESTHTVVFTGAGMSTESGIPDFRSKEGWWNKIDPMTVSTIDALENEYDLFQAFYSLRLGDLKTCRPHKGHTILADLEQQKLISAVITQNVDGFHQNAGNENVYELHGSLRSIFCSKCGHASNEDAFVHTKPCIKCKGHLRPDIILFGELLPQEVWGDAMKEIEQSDLVIVIGSSLQVAPANELPFLTSGRKVVINNESTLLHNQFDLQIEGNAGDILQNVHKYILEVGK